MHSALGGRISSLPDLVSSSTRIEKPAHVCSEAEPAPGVPVHGYQKRSFEDYFFESETALVLLLLVR